MFMLASGQSYKVSTIDRKLRLSSHTWLENTPYYEYRVVIYDQRGFIRLATDG